MVSTSSKVSVKLPAPLELFPTAVETASALQESSPMENVLLAAMLVSLPSTEPVFLATPTVLHAQATSTSAPHASTVSQLIQALDDVFQSPNAPMVKNQTMETVRTSVTVDSSTTKVSAFMVDALLDMLITDLEDAPEVAHQLRLLAAQLDSSCSMELVFPTAVLDSMEILSVRNA